MESDSTAYVFIDESYSIVGGAGKPNFYLFAVVYVPADSKTRVRELLLSAVGSDYFHSRELLLGQTGQQKLVDIAKSMPTELHWSVFYASPLAGSDRNGELSRAALLKHAISEIWLRSDVDVVDITLEARPRGYLQQADARTIAGLRSQLPDLIARTRGPDDEPLLWLPDLLATAFRQAEIHARFKYLEAFRSLIQVHRVDLTRP